MPSEGPVAPSSGAFSPVPGGDERGPTPEEGAGGIPFDFNAVAARVGLIGWEVDAGGRCVHASAAVEEVLGYPPATLLEPPFLFDLCIPETRQRTRQDWRELCARGAPVRDWLVAFEHRDGHAAWLSLNGFPLLDASGELLGYRGIAVEVTAYVERECALADRQRCESERALRQARDLLRNVIDAVPQFVFWKDRQSVFLGCNAKGARILGLASPEAIVGKTDYDLPTRPEEAAFYRACDERVMSTGQAEYRIIEPQRQADGKEALLETNKIPLFDEAEDCNGILVTFEDITERVQEERRLRQYAGLIASLLDSMPDAVFYKDRDGRYLGCNPAAEEAIGRARADILGRTDRDLFTPEMAERLIEEDRRVMDHRQPLRREVRLIDARGQGRLFEVLKTPYLDADGALIGVLGISRDVTARETAEIVLRKSEQRLRALLGHLPVGVVVVDNATRRFRFANRPFCQMLGYTWEELSALTPADVHPPEQREALMKILGQVLRGELTRVEHLPFLRRDGSRFLGEIENVPLELDGRPCVLGTLTDVTKRQRTLDEVRRAQRLYELLTEISTTYINLPGDRFDAAVTQSLRQLCSFFSSDRCVVVVYDPRQRQGPAWRVAHMCQVEDTSPAFDPSPFAWLAGYIECLDRLACGETLYLTRGDGLAADAPLSGDMARRGISRIIAAPLMDGERCLGYVSMEAVRGRASGDPAEQRLLALFAQMLANVMVRLSALAKLEEQRRFLSDIVENSNALIYLKSADGRYRTVNRRLEEATGLPREQVLGRTDRELFSDSIAEQFAANDRRVLTAGSVLETEEELAVADDRRAFLSVKFPVRDHAGQITGVAGISTDITDRKAAESERLARHAAEAANRAKSAFLANMSHEIRTPLNAVIGFAQVLTRDPTLNAQQAEQVRTIARGGQHLLMLINDILDLSRIEAGHTRLNSAPLDLIGLLDDLVVLFRPRAEARGLWLRLASPPELPRIIETDEAKLRQILINLVGNAVKFTATGGVTVQTRLDAAAGEAGGRVLEIEVRDTGPGIAQADQALVFEAFHQTDLGREAGGTGLGLAISRQLAGLLGGELGLISQPERGSRFCLRLPLRCAPDAAARAMARDPSKMGRPRMLRLEPGLPPPLILIADDRDDNRHLLRDLLTPVGFAVIEAANGQLAVEAFARHAPDAILMDLRMPVMDGVMAIRHIKSTILGRATPVIAVTASAFETDRQELLATGADAYLRKPIEAEPLFAALQQALSLRFEILKPDSELARARADLEPGDLAAVPAELRERLSQALMRGDVAQLKQLNAEVATIDPGLAEGLEDLLQRYDYDRLERLLSREDAP